MLQIPHVIAILVVVAHLNAVGGQAENTVQQQLFERAAGVLKENCFKCHSGRSPKAHLDLTTRVGILKGGESGVSAFEPENSLESGLVLAIQYKGPEMPPTGKMSPEQIEILVEWFEAGMPWPADAEEIEFGGERSSPTVNKETRRFWCFQPVQQQDVPDHDWGHNPIDAFVGHRLQEKGLSPSCSADARTLVRRMYYDLTGLPPEPSEAREWAVKLTATDGLNQHMVRELVEFLLASPHYGEKWGRHWLDLVRYAETNSYERDGAKPFVWRYRDYVICSLNDDKPYDQFVREQLAGDELPAATPESIVATGYYRLGRWDDEAVDHRQAFYDDLDDILMTTSQTFLGLTVNCARCHDHKIDPIPQRDYYRLLGFFHNVRRYGVRSDESVRAASVREINLPEEFHVTAQQQQAHELKIIGTQRQMKAIEDTVLPHLSDVEKDDFQYVENRMSVIQRQQGRLLTEVQVSEYGRLEKQMKRLNNTRPSGLAQALCVTEDVSSMRPVQILIRGNAHAPGKEVTPGFPEVLSPPHVTMPDISEGAASTGRRRILADWIVSPENPLTSRVMVNRIWQFHFGRGIVRSSSDFGFQGTPPTHPRLLDWLASQFVDKGWSMKDMHRLIMMSATYQMSSKNRPDAWETDPVNDLFWRFDMRRLTAEEIRDSILQVSGQLNTEKMYGPGIYTDIPDEVKAGQSRPGNGWGRSLPEDEVRRSIYIHVKRSLKDPLLEVFDAADTDQACPVRFVTTQPTQALGMLNGAFVRKQAGHMAEFLKAAAPDSVPEQVRLAMVRVTQREPTANDIRRGTELIDSLVREHQRTFDEALEQFCLVTLNFNEFIFLD